MTELPREIEINAVCLNAECIDYGIHRHWFIKSANDDDLVTLCPHCDWLCDVEEIYS
jgi:hypothetical protein